MEMWLLMRCGLTEMLRRSPTRSFNISPR
jgi:hypothetical protein